MSDIEQRLAAEVHELRKQNSIFKHENNSLRELLKKARGFLLLYAAEKEYQEVVSGVSDAGLAELTKLIRRIVGAV